jgi:hypothetical protein
VVFHLLISLLLALGTYAAHFGVFSNPSQGGGFCVESLPIEITALSVCDHLKAFNPSVLIKYKFHRLIS